MYTLTFTLDFIDEGNFKNKVLKELERIIIDAMFGEKITNTKYQLSDDGLNCKNIFDMFVVEIFNHVDIGDDDALFLRNLNINVTRTDDSNNIIETYNDIETFIATNV